MSYYNQQQPPVGVPPPQGQSVSHRLDIIYAMLSVSVWILWLSAGGICEGRLSAARISTAGISSTRLSSAGISSTRISSTSSLCASVRSASSSASKFSGYWLLGRMVSPVSLFVCEILSGGELNRCDLTVDGELTPSPVREHRKYGADP
ncbi:uncharacterized protein G2W53_032065 [Senna tora]|uniref:Uncharacterized protein n=1 Tax=Senna tora TaxID=362788 RepID=A0A834SW10_9FABA|nr:uncharacterized protein G2W53_032065 [Senna tora]